MKYIFTTSIFLMMLCSFGQHQRISLSPSTNGYEANAGTKSPIMQATLHGEVIQSKNNTKWATNLRPQFSRKHISPDVDLIKAKKNQIKIENNTKSGELATSTMSVLPEIGTNFEANWSLQGTPPDNSMAISNGGKIVTCNNDGIEYYDDNGTFLLFDYWSDFFNDGSLSSVLYDPKVIYDSQEDRFILVVLHGSTSSTSQVLLCFSKTNNPQDGWWVYKISGNPASDGSWFDYPNIGVSNDEVFISGNLFSNAGSFNQAVVFQVEKAAGLSGNNINFQYYANLSASPYTAFTLVPMSYGKQGNYGPGTYLVSNSSSGSNSVRLWEISNTIASGSNQINSTAVTIPLYQVAADASQSGSADKLDNGDCRVQSGFYLDTLVHFVFHSDIGSGWNGINYSRIDVSTNTLDNQTFGLSGSYDYSYPAVVPFSNAPGDKSVMVGFLRSSGSSFPELRVVNCDHTMNWSNSTQIKAGETFVNFLTGDERWGDYTGIARKHNDPTGNIWVAGCYGADINSSQGTFPNTWKTYVAEVFSSATPPLGIEDNKSEKQVSIYPNPVIDLFQLEFEVENRDIVTIQILDQNGKLVKDLYKDAPKKGLNRLTFNKGALAQGTYFVKISNNQEIIKNEKIIILD